MKSRRRLTAVLAALAATAFGLVAVPGTAHAGIWHDYPPAANRTCSQTDVYNGTAYQVCLEFNFARTQVRTVAFINPGAYTNFQVNLRLKFGGGGPDITDSCPTMSTNGSRACYTAFTDLRRPYALAEATFGIAGQWMPKLRSLDMRLSGKVQEEANWCGPAAAQTTLATIGYSVPSQRQLADDVDMSFNGVTLPGRIPPAMNGYIPSGDWKYEFESFHVAHFEGGVRRIIQSLDRGRPVIVLVIPNRLPWAGDSSSLLRHYVTIHGYGGTVNGDGSVEPRTFKVADPADGSEHAIAVDTLLRENAMYAYVALGSIAVVRS